ncbi:uncharacterized protein [Macrobrachium rosenbergii]|uniref:uncharacterized protein n=1 Tax=Macrobrachium rosenbergii TaxID=79674 RepID=UPI0034D4E9FA
MVQKPDGPWRPCGDCRQLNLATEPDLYHLPNMRDPTASFHGTKIFSKLDLLKSYFQVPVAPEDIPKTVIITPFGSYVSAYSIFGLRNAGATFQRLMDSILGDLNFCVCYIDDILIFSRSHKEHCDTSGRQLCAVYWAVGHFKFLLEGTPFTVWTDHQPLVHASRQQRYLAAIVEFTCTIKYLPSRKNPVADALSRIEINAVQLGIDYEDLAQEQSTDPEVPAYRTAITSLKWKNVPLAPGGPTLLSNVSLGHPRLLVPASHRCLVFNIIHGLSHPSSRTTVKLLAESTTTYNPTANGLVERFHRSLKVSLMARCTTENWKYQLAWVLLGLRTAPKANGDLSAAEKVYGESFVVLGEFIMGDHRNLTVQRLCDTVGKFAPCQRTYTNRTTPFMPPGLSSTNHVFVRNDAICLPLTRPYRGPFLVLERNKNAFWLAIHGKND